MDASSVVALVAAVVSALAALVSAWIASHTAASARLAAADEVASRFREPMLQAAFNLQTRMYNIVNLRFLQVYGKDDNSPQEREYAVENTLYLFGQYFCWVEILRRESQFLDPRRRERNRVIAQRLEQVRDALSSSAEPETAMRIFRGEQRAIGEVMLDSSGAPGSNRPRWDCLGYAAFVAKRDEETFARWFAKLKSDLVSVRDDPRRTARLVSVQHALLELIHTLDPSAERVSEAMLTPLKKA